MARKMIISTKQCGAYTTHCQLHGEPTEHPAYTHCKFVIDGQKVRHFNLHEGATNRQVLEALTMMDLNINDFDYQFVRWENFNLLNKALVMPSLPVGLVEGSNCDDNLASIYNKGQGSLIDGLIFNKKRLKKCCIFVK